MQPPVYLSAGKRAIGVSRIKSGKNPFKAYAAQEYLGVFPEADDAARAADNCAFYLNRQFPHLFCIELNYPSDYSQDYNLPPPTEKTEEILNRVGLSAPAAKQGSALFVTPETIFRGLQALEAEAVNFLSGLRTKIQTMRRSLDPQVYAAELAEAKERRQDEEWLAKIKDPVKRERERKALEEDYARRKAKLEADSPSPTTA